MPTIQFIDALRQLCDEPSMRNLGREIVMSPAASNTFTTPDAEMMTGGASAYDAEQFKDNYIWWPAGAADDQKRKIVSMVVSASVSTVTVNRVYANSGSSVVGFLLAIDPDILMNMANDCISYDLFLECVAPLFHGPPSADMYGSSVDSDWTESGATDTVQTTATEVLEGPQSFVVTGSAALDYTQSALQPLAQGTSAIMHFRAKSDTGTTTFKALDASGNVQGSIVTTQEQWIYGSKIIQYDSGEEQIRLRIEATTASASVDVQSFGFVRLYEQIFYLPAWVDARWKLARVDYAQYHQSGSEADTWLAQSVEYHRLEPSGPDPDYRFIARQADANPNMIWVKEELLAYPLYLVVMCPYGAPYGVSTLFTSSSSTNSVPMELLIPAWKRRIGAYAPTSTLR